MLEAGYKRNTTVGEPSVVVKPWSEHSGSRVSDGLWGRVQKSSVLHSKVIPLNPHNYSIIPAGEETEP